MAAIRKLLLPFVVCEMVCMAAPSLLASRQAVPEKQGLPVTFHYLSDEAWAYVRRGLCYLESPLPLRAPEAVPPSYVHPDKKGFGAYGLTPGAYEDVQRAYPYFRAYAWQEVLGSAKLYELANRAFAEILLSRLQGYLKPTSTPREVFQVVHQAWNVGLQGFKDGRRAVASRFVRAQEFVRNNS